MTGGRVATWALMGPLLPGPVKPPGVYRRPGARIPCIDCSRPCPILPGPIAVVGAIWTHPWCAIANAISAVPGVPWVRRLSSSFPEARATKALVDGRPPARPRGLLANASVPKPP